MANKTIKLTAKKDHAKITITAKLLNLGVYFDHNTAYISVGQMKRIIEVVGDIPEFMFSKHNKWSIDDFYVAHRL